MKLGITAAKKGGIPRSQYIREQRKVKEWSRSGCSPDDVYVPKWDNFLELGFLGSACEEVPTECSLQGYVNVPEHSEPSEVLEESSTADPTEEGGNEQKQNGPAKQIPRRDEVPTTDLLTAVTQRLKKPVDECTAYGQLIEHLVSGIPQGLNRDMAMMLGQQAVIKFKLSLVGQPAELMEYLDADPIVEL